MALRPVHLHITHDDRITPARGRITFRTSYALRDVAGDVVHGPVNRTVRLDDTGQATVELPPTDDPAYSPTGGTVTVVVDTDVWLATFSIEVPSAGSGTLEFADLVPVEAAPAVVTYALAAQLAAYLPRAGGTMTGALVLAADPAADMHAATRRYVDQAAATGGVPNATTGAVGLVQLAGDLGGTATAPTVPGLAQRQPLDADLTAFAALAPADDDLLQRKAGAWTARTLAAVKTDMGLDDVPTLDDLPPADVVRRAYVTSGNVDPFPNTGGSWAVLPGFELAIPAAVGDDVEVSVHAMRTNTESAFLDVAVLVGSTIVRYLATGTSSPAIEGDPGWYPGAPGTHYPTQSGARGFTVEAGHLDGGQVRFVLVCLAAGAGRLYASASFPFYWQARNTGVVT